jgi:hypothetical protein
MMSETTSAMAMSYRQHYQVRKCDICHSSSSSSDLLGLKPLKECKKCGVLVHPECYGLQCDDSNGLRLDDDFVCHACDAVGKEFEVAARDSHTGQHVRVCQVERPTHCALCSVDDGVHAMHPLYDTHGPCGRQILRSNPDRLAWVHTLCASAIATKFGYIYGCCRDGTYECNPRSSSSSSSSRKGKTEKGTVYYYDASRFEGRKPNPLLLISDSKSDNSLHHYVYCSKTVTNNKALQEQKSLKCYMCGKVDMSSEILCIAVQCNAGSVDEYPKFQNCHTEMGLTWCTQAMHVGCVAWAKHGNHHVRKSHTFFHPGSDVTKQEPMADVYCSAHADDVLRYIRQCRTRNRFVYGRTCRLKDRRTIAARTVDSEESPLTPELVIDLTGDTDSEDDDDETSRKRLESRVIPLRRSSCASESSSPNGGEGRKISGFSNPRRLVSPPSTNNVVRPNAGHAATSEIRESRVISSRPASFASKSTSPNGGEGRMNSNLRRRVTPPSPKVGRRLVGQDIATILNSKARTTSWEKQFPPEWASSKEALAGFEPQKRKKGTTEDRDTIFQHLIRKKGNRTSNGLAITAASALGNYLPQPAGAASNSFPAGNLTSKIKRADSPEPQKDATKPRQKFRSIRDYMMSVDSGATATPNASATSPRHQVDCSGYKDCNHDNVTSATDTSKTSSSSFKWPLDKVPRKSNCHCNVTGRVIHTAVPNPAGSTRLNYQQSSKNPVEHNLATTRVKKGFSTAGNWKKIMPRDSFKKSKKTKYRSSMLDGRIRKRQRLG